MLLAGNLILKVLKIMYNLSQVEKDFIMVEFTINTEKSTPGPMDYHNKTIEPDGIYLLSNMKGSGRRTFMGGKRKLKLDVNEENPGPGSYRAPSDFGHYESEIRPSTARAWYRNKCIIY